MERMKACTLCAREKPLSEFSKHRLSKDGLAHWCKECNRKRSKAFRASPSGIYTLLKGRQTYARTHIGKKDRGYHLTIKPLTISRGEFVVWYNFQSKFCAYCGISESFLGDTGDKYNDKNKRLSVDCMDNELGYSLGNLVLACSRCNSIKSDFFTHEEMLEIGRLHVSPKWLGKAISDWK